MHEPIESLIERALRGEADHEELQRLAAWRQLSPSNERQYRQLERLVAGTHTLRGELRETVPPSAASLLSAARAMPRVPAPAVPAARGRGSRWSVTRWAPWGIAAAALLLLGVSLSRDRTEPDLLARPDIVTGASELATVQLGDGSVIRLGPSSRLRVGGRADAREVSLDGRAFFAIAPQPHRPFLVKTRAGDARVLGTRFELVTRESELELVVVEGRVALEAATNRVEVVGGETSRVVRGAASAPVTVASADSALRWIGRFLVFQATPLADAAREIERAYGVHVSITDSMLGRETVKVTFIDESALEIGEMLCSMVNAQCAWTGDTLTMRRRGAGGAP
jgi:transmembrane sensor